MIEIPMPRLSDSMEEGTILRWLAEEGASVTRGQELAEIETDKASMVYEADEAGVLHTLAAEGDTLPVGAPIAQLLADGEQPPAVSRAAASRAGASNGLPAGAGGPPPAATAGEAPQRSEQAPQPSGDRVKASPLARRLAADANLELSALAGTGPGGRIVKADVERAATGEAAGGGAEGAALAQGAAAAGGAVADVPRASTPMAKGASQVHELTRTQSLIARRMAEAKATIPEFTLRCDVDMEAAVEMRASLKRLAERGERERAPSVNDLIVRACGLALREHPRANGTYRDGAFELHERVNVGVAVASADALLVPVVRDADRLSVWEIATEARRLAAAVRDGTITPPELSGATFSVSNLGMYGIDSFTAVINPPQAAILAVGSLAQRPVVRDGRLAVAHTISLTLACDHRILYGADAAEFLGAVRESLQDPLRLLT